MRFVDQSNHLKLSQLLKKSLYLVLLCFALAAHAAKVDINGRITDAGSGIGIKLWVYDNGQQLPLSVTTSQADGTFAFHQDLLQPTLFAIQVEEGQKMAFLVGANDTLVVLQGPLADLKSGQAAFKPYAELQAYHEWEQYLGEYEKQSAVVLNAWQSVPNTKPTFLKDRQRLGGRMDTLAKKYDDKLKLLISQYPTTYTAKVLARLAWVQHRNLAAPYDKFDTEFAFQHAHYWDSVPFANADLLRHPYLAQRLSYYMTNFVPNNPAGIQSAIDQIFGHKEMAPAVYTYFMQYFLGKLAQKEYPELVKYLNDNYGNASVSSQSLASLQNANRLNVGATLDGDILLRDVAGDLLSLHQTADKKRLTILYFWQPNCSHCEDFNKLLAANQQLLQQSDVGIYAICITDNQATFANSSKEEQIVWPNVSDLKGWSSTLAADYNVHFTPGIFIVDKNLTIVAKGMEGNQVLETLKGLR